MDELDIHSVIARIKERHALKSNYAVAKFMQITHQTLANWLKGRTFPDEGMCLKLGAAADLDAGLLSAYYQYRRAVTDEAREVWLGVVRRLLLAVAGSAIIASELAMHPVARNAVRMLLAR